MKKVFKEYMDDIELEKWQWIGVICLIIVISGIFGFVYEYIFYYFNDGKFSWQGGNFLPWINIYAYGALIIILLSLKSRKNPLLVFIISIISTGILEYLTGFVLHEFFDVRYWDYNKEIINFGNINGYICLRSVLFFGVSGLLLMYGILPFCIYLSKTMNKEMFLTFSIILCIIFLTDEIYNLIIAKTLNLKDAITIYKQLTIK
ncbi:MAG: putative ABC transporter permease [Bacilli bacterium]|nr:putative ABC transporter permease [Bacilli bacterium]